jgi:5-methylcytosine-specific restriction endonuclease McrA
MCAKQGRDKALDVVHHIVPIDKGGARLDMENLMSLCTMHHEEIHKGERWGR